MALPEEVTVIVCAARNVKGRKKGVPNVSVVFGIGKTKFKTTAIPSDNPTWNEESTFTIHGNDPLKFKIRDRDETIGQVLLPLSQIPPEKNRRARWTPFQAPHSWKHGSSDAILGELNFNAWVSKGPASTIDVQTALKRLPKPRREQPQNQFPADPDDIESEFDRTQSARRDERTGSFSGRGLQHTLSMSTGDLHSAGGANEPKSKGSSSLRRGSLGHGSHGDVSGVGRHKKAPSISSLVDVKRKEPAASTPPPHKRTASASSSTSGFQPEVTGIAPRSGPLRGGTRLVLRGSNLGQCADDVCGLTVCGVDCLSTLEYSSPAKLICTTCRGRDVGSGPVIVKTKSGGKGTSLITFTYKEHDYDPEEIPTEKTMATPTPTTTTTSRPLSGSFRLLKKDSGSKKEKVLPREAELLKKVDDLQQHVKDLEEENRDLKKYVDDLLSRIMEKNPELLMQH